jgi:branched-chain amino acid transport system ATP-binding protein
MAEPVLSIRDLYKSYGALTVTDHVSLDILPGELHAIIGPNGAGKTTLIHQLAGSLASDGGTILYLSADMTHAPIEERVRQGIARTFQITSVLTGFTALENVALALQARSGSSFRFFGRVDREEMLNRDALESLRQVGLQGRAGQLAGKLSHGEKRQLELAIALATKPQLLLLDEPLAGTSHEESAALIALLRQLKGRHTIVLIEHDMEAVFALADRISVMANGRVLITGDPQAVRADRRVREVYLGEEEASPC